MSEREIEIWNSKIISMLDIIPWKHLKITEREREFLEGSKDFKSKTIHSVLSHLSIFLRFLEGKPEKLVREDIAHAVAVFGSIQDKNLKDLSNSEIEVFLAHISIVAREVSDAMFD